MKRFGCWYFFVLYLFINAGIAVFGPAGFLIGGALFLGLVFFVNLFSDETKTSTSERSGYEFIEQAFLNLIVAVLKSGRGVTREQLNIINVFYISRFGYGINMHQLQAALLSGQAENTVYNSCAYLNRYLNYSQRLEMVRFLYELARLSQPPTAESILLLQTITAYLQINFNEKTGTGTATQSLDSHYEKLGLASSATNDEVKRAYKKLALKYHPDRIQTNDPVEQKKANELFQEINSAYDTVKKQRGMK